MKWFLVLLAALIFAGAVIVRVQGGFSASASRSAASSQAAGVALADAAPAYTAEQTLTGTAIMDVSTGLPAVPFIQYADRKGRTATKQLIFADARGCLPSAGDIPCVPGYPVRSAYPSLTTGEPIRVTGYMVENRFLITSFEEGM